MARIELISKVLMFVCIAFAGDAYAESRAELQEFKAELDALQDSLVNEQIKREKVEKLTWKRFVIPLDSRREKKPEKQKHVPYGSYLEKYRKEAESEIEQVEQEIEIPPHSATYSGF